LVNKARAARDRNTGAQVDTKRGQVRKAPARRKARWGLLKSAARFQGRRLLAALVGGALGVLGCLTTPLGKKLGWSWLIHPGRRLYRRLLLSAREARAARDEQIRATRAAEEAAADGDPHEIGDRVARPARIIPAAPTAAQEAIHVSGFNFEEAAAEMENAARTYDPDGNMEVLAMIDNLPTALLSIANTFRILAERSDEEFAFEKDVAAGFDDIHRTLLNAVDAGETLVPLFRSVHAQDIARHEDPRNGTEAEKGWNV
jgi:molecular chaperone GrpE (heat shock protein)